MNDVKRRLLEDTVKELCKGCDSIFDERLGDSQPGIEEQIDELTGFITRPNLKICVNCEYFLAAEDSPFDDFTAACVFGCVRPQNPIGYCNAFKGR